MSDFEIAVGNAIGAIEGAINNLDAVRGSLEELQTMAGAEAALRKTDRKAMQAVIRDAEVARDQFKRERDIAVAELARIQP
jgi:hypothetical protein